MHSKSFTGERLETFVNSEVSIEHLHRYAILLSLVKGKNVLDIASGEGYGTNLLATTAANVTGVDISATTISEAQQKYKRSNLRFLQGSAAEIPVKSGTIDIVVSFETIEHHDQHEKMMSEIKRVLKPGGLCVISSPDKLNYTDRRGFDNPFHVKELYKEEFKNLINENFKNADFYYQRGTFASILLPEKEVKSFREFTGDYGQINEATDFLQMYIISVASDSELPTINLTVFTDDALLHRLHQATVETVRQTSSYKIGHAILWPIKAIKKLVS